MDYGVRVKVMWIMGLELGLGELGQCLTLDRTLLTVVSHYIGTDTYKVRVGWVGVRDRGKIYRG